MYMICLFMLLAGNAWGASDNWTYRKDSIGQTHITGPGGVKGIARKDSIGQTTTQYNNGYRCVGRFDSIGQYKESCK